MSLEDKTDELKAMSRDELVAEYHRLRNQNTYDQCGCEEVELRRREYEGGAVQCVYQCLQCGRQKGQAVAHDDVDGSVSHLPAFDSGREERWRQKKQQRYEARESRMEAIDRRIQQLDGRRYDEYLKTERWEKKREAVMARDDGVCQACLGRDAEEVHHLTYEHIGDEPLFELVAICEPCHEKVTKMDKSGRSNFFGHNL